MRKPLTCRDVLFICSSPIELQTKAINRPEAANEVSHWPAASDAEAMVTESPQQSPKRKKTMDYGKQKERKAMAARTSHKEQEGGG